MEINLEEIGLERVNGIDYDSYCNHHYQLRCNCMYTPVKKGHTPYLKVDPMYISAVRDTSIGMFDNENMWFAKSQLRISHDNYILIPMWLCEKLDIQRDEHYYVPKT